MNIDLAALPDDVETLQRMVRTLAADRTALSDAQAASFTYGQCIVPIGNIPVLGYSRNDVAVTIFGWFRAIEASAL